MKKVGIRTCLQLSKEAADILAKVHPKSKGLFVSHCIVETFKNRKDITRFFMDNDDSPPADIPEVHDVQSHVNTPSVQPSPLHANNSANAVNRPVNHTDDADDDDGELEFDLTPFESK